MCAQFPLLLFLSAGMTRRAPFRPISLGLRERITWIRRPSQPRRAGGMSEEEVLLVLATEIWGMFVTTA